MNMTNKQRIGGDSVALAHWLMAHMIILIYYVIGKFGDLQFEYNSNPGVEFIVSTIDYPIYIIVESIVGHYRKTLFLTMVIVESTICLASAFYGIIASFIIKIVMIFWE